MRVMVVAHRLKYILLSLLFWPGVLCSQIVTPSVSPHPKAEERLPRSMLSNLPLLFEENEGQADKSTRFVARGAGYTLVLNPDGVVLNLSSEGNNHKQAVSLQLLGAQEAQLFGREPTATQINYYMGKDPADWHLHVPSYRSVVYAGVYKGIDVVYHGNGHQMEYDFVVSPGADATQVRMRFDGLKPVMRGQDLSFEEQASLSVKSLKAYQMFGGDMRKVDASWKVTGDMASIDLGSYDHSRELIIDPIFFYGTYIGGDQNDVAVSIVPASQPGYYYVALSTSSSRIEEPVQTVVSPPANPAPANPNSTGTDTLILGIDTTNSPGPPSPLPPFPEKPIPLPNPNLTIGSVTFFGGNAGTTKPTGMVADQNSNLYVTGTTDVGTTLPQLGSQTCSSCNGFVAKFATSLNATTHSATLNLQYSFGLPATPMAIAVDEGGDAYLTGSALTSVGSQMLTVPSKDIPFQNQAAPSIAQTANPHAFLLELDPMGTTLFCSYLGGSSTEQGNAIAVSKNLVIVAGQTSSADFPRTQGAFQKTIGGGQDAFVIAARDLATDPQLSFSTYLGGSDTDTALSVAVAPPSGNIVVAGSTKSTQFPPQPPKTFSLASWPIFNSNGSQGGIPRFPTTPPTTALLPNAVPMGSEYAFVASLSSDGTKLVFTDFLGGDDTNDVTRANAVTVDNIGVIYVTGSSSGTTSEPIDALVQFLGGLASSDITGDTGSPGGVSDVFFGEIDPRGEYLLEGTLAYSLGTNTANGLTVSGPLASAGIVSIVGSVAGLVPTGLPTDAELFYAARNTNLYPVQPTRPTKTDATKTHTTGFFVQEELAGYCDMQLTAQVGTVLTFSGPCVSGTQGGTLFASPDPANSSSTLLAAIAVTPSASSLTATVSIDVSSLSPSAVKFTFGFLPLGAVAGLGFCTVTVGYVSPCAISTSGGGSGEFFRDVPGDLSVSLGCMDIDCIETSPTFMVGQPIKLTAMVKNGIPATVNWSSSGGTFDGDQPSTVISFTPTVAADKLLVIARPVANPDLMPLASLPLHTVAPPTTEPPAINGPDQMIAGTYSQFSTNYDVTVTTVTWDASPFKIEQTGKFTAPNPPPNPPTVTITATPTGVSAKQVTKQVNILRAYSFTLQQSVTLPLGKPVNVPISLPAGVGINGESVSFSCTPAFLPTGVNCSFFPNPVINDGNAKQITLQLISSGVAEVVPLRNGGWKGFILTGSSFVVAGSLLWMRRKRWKGGYPVISACLSLMFFIVLSACGTGGSFTSPSQQGHPMGTHQIEIDMQGPNAADQGKFAENQVQPLAKAMISITLQ